MQQKSKKQNSIVPTKDDIVLVFEEKVPRQNWCLGKIVEILPSRDDQVRGAKVLIGKSKHVIERPINKLFPIEFAGERNKISGIYSKSTDENAEKGKSNIIDIINDEKASTSNNEKSGRSKRKAAIMADIKRKFNQ